MKIQGVISGVQIVQLPIASLEIELVPLVMLMLESSFADPFARPMKLPFVVAEMLSHSFLVSVIVRLKVFSFEAESIHPMKPPALAVALMLPEFVPETLPVMFPDIISIRPMKPPAASLLAIPVVSTLFSFFEAEIVTVIGCIEADMTPMIPPE